MTGAVENALVFRLQHERVGAAAHRVLAVSRHGDAMMRRAVLLGRAGYDVTGVLGARTGRQLLEKEQYEVVIVGGAVPARQRAALLAAVHRLQPRARVLAISATPCPEAGADAVLDARSSAEELLRVLRALLP